ncbi:MAG: two-component regulator propeller domain-containing protein, partial [Bacteroidota bacterium]
MTTLLFSVFGLCAQDAPPGYIQHWNDKDGLPNNLVYCALTDQFGQVWVGTTNGLCRFDGQSFDCFQTNPKDLTALQGNEVRELFEAPDGKIWVGTDGGGLSLFDPKTEQFKTLKQNLEDPASGLTENRVYEVYLHPVDAELIVGYRAIGSGQGGITKMDFDGQIIDHELTEERDYAGFPLKVTEYWIDPNDRNTHWVGGRSFYRYDAKSKRMEEFTHPSFQKNMNSIVGITGNSDSTLFVGHFYDGLQQFNPKSGTWGKMLDDSHCYDLIQDNHDRIWVANRKGIGIVDPVSGAIDYRIPKTGSASPFPENTFIRSIHVHDELVWICADNGLFCWSPHFQQFPAEAIVYQSQKAFYPQWKGQDQANHHWIISQNLGLLELNSDWQVLRNYDLPFERNAFSGVQLRDGRLLLGAVQGIFFFSGTADVESSSESPWQYDWDNWSFSGFHPDSIQVWYFRQDREGFVWLGTRYKGLIRMDLNNRSFQQFVHDPENLLSLSHDKYLFHIDYGPDDHLWVCSDKGLSIINPQTLQFVDHPKIRKQLGNLVVHCLVDDGRGHLWIGTRDQGLFRYHPDKEELVQYTLVDGLPYNGVNEMLRQQDWLWMATRQGLVRFNLERETFEVFDRTKGLVSNTLYAARLANLPSGEVIMTYYSPYF